MHQPMETLMFEYLKAKCFKSTRQIVFRIRLLILSQFKFVCLYGKCFDVFYLPQMALLPMNPLLTRYPQTFLNSTKIFFENRFEKIRI
jgi:hypothetical protein